MRIILCISVPGWTQSPSELFFTMTDYEKIISYENLLKAHKRARQSKQHKKEVIEFELNLSQNLWSLHYDLKYHKYKISGYHRFMIYDPKEREIQAISYRDRVVQHSLCDNFLTPLLEKHLVNANCACRKNKGTDYAIKLLRSFMTRHYKKYGRGGYFIKFDVSKYFPSIDHQVLKSKLWRLVKDCEVRNLLETVIDSFGGEKGLPMGNQSSQNFALLYLDSVDRYIKEGLGVKFYVRYMDDMILLVDSKKKAMDIFEKIFIKIQEQKILVNPKSSISSVDCGLNFLGWHFFYSSSGKVVQKLKNQSKRRIFLKVSFLRYQVKQKQKSVLDWQTSMTSYKGHLCRGNSWTVLQKLKIL